MTVIVSAFSPSSPPATQTLPKVLPEDMDKLSESKGDDLKPDDSPGDSPQQIKTRYAALKELRDWVNSILLGMTLAGGLIMTIYTLSKSDIKEITKALSSNDANLKEIVGALVKNNAQIGEVVRQNNENVKGAIGENTKYLKEVMKVLDTDGNGEISENEMNNFKNLLEGAKEWKRFTDAINEATRKK